MTKPLSILLPAVVACAFAGCTREEPDVTDHDRIITIQASLSDVLTKVDFVPGTDAEGRSMLSVAWAEGDMIRVYNHSDHSLYADFTLDPSCAGLKSGSFTGPSFSAPSYDIEVLCGEVDYIRQTQPSDGSAGDLKYRACVEDAPDYTHISFTGVSGVLNLQVRFPSSEVAAAVRSAEISASQPIFQDNGISHGKTLTVTITTPGDKDSDAVLNLYASLPVGRRDIPSGTTLLVRFLTPGIAQQVYSCHVRLPAVSLLPGKMNKLLINAENASLYAGQEDNGTLEAPYLIADKYQLQAIRGLLEDGSVKCFLLLDDISLDGESWTALNNTSPYQKYLVFDGNGHTIRNFTSTGSYASLFGVLNGQVKNLTVEDAAIVPSGSKCGVLAAFLGSGGTQEVSVSNVTVRNSHVGTADNKSSAICGILSAQLGREDTVVSDVTVSGSGVYASSNYVGGLIGTVEKTSTIANCHVSGCEVVGNSATGGFVGQFGKEATSASCTACSVSGTSVSGNGNVGGFAGLQHNDVSLCRVESDVTVSASGNNVGGFSGFLRYRSLENSYTRATVSGNNAVGGMIGYLQNNEANSRVNNCYAACTLSSNNGRAGFIGAMGGGTASGCISWNEDLTFANTSNNAVVEASCYTKAASETGTVSSHAMEEARGWSGDIWDFSSDYPVQKASQDPVTPAAEAVLPVLPYPMSVQMGTGSFSVYGAPVYYDSSLDKESADIVAPFAARLGQTADGVSGEQSGGFNFLPDNTLAKEAYSLSVTGSKVVVKASSREGFFYAIQTIRQLLPTEVYGTAMVTDAWTLPCVQIQDRPRFPYRGMHLDVSRHFFGVREVKRYLDIMSIYKLNRFHWHLTDDQGWRIQIDGYPALTTAGATRNGTMVGKDFNSNDGIVYGPYFFTKEEIREIIRYARERCITIIPEIDLPGHMIAAQAAYHSLGCNGSTDYQVWTRWGVSPNALCLGKSATWDFLHGVLDEVAELFPGEYIHIGGDEIPSGVSWNTCPDCQAFIGTLGFPSVSGVTTSKQLQFYTAKAIQEYLAGKGKKVICWQETFDGIGADDGSRDIVPGFRAADFAAKGGAIMSWTSASVGIKAAKAGVDAIMAPSWGCYLDCRQSNAPGEPISPSSNGDRPVTMANTYSLNPVSSVPEDSRSHVLGAEGALWTEYITTPSHLEYMLLPRLTALSEVQWTETGNKDMDRVKAALVQKHFLIYDAMGYSYRNIIDF